MATATQPARLAGNAKKLSLNDLRTSGRKLPTRVVMHGVDGVGKAQPLDARILTPGGYIAMGEVQVGFDVIGSDGLPHKILGVYPQGKKAVFKLTLANGSSTRCCNDHLWLTCTGSEMDVRSTRSIFNDLALGTRSHSVPCLDDALRPVMAWPSRCKIEDIEHVGTEECQCILVDAPDSLYVTDDLILTHNTSFAASAPKPVFIMTRGESGLETLIDSGQLGDIPHFPEVQTWDEVLSACDTILNEQHDFKTLVLDTGNGAERLCHEEVCRREYSGDWGAKGFTSYQQGFEVSLADWRMFLSKLDNIREQKMMAIIILVHTKIGTFKNPGAADYDRYEGKMHAKTWGLLKEWSDIVLFADYEVEVVTDKRADATKKGKALGGQYRIMHTTRTATYDAKNRHGLPDEIEMGNSGAEAWANFIAAMKGSKT